MGTVKSLAIRLEDLLAHLLRGEPPKYELARAPYWDEDQGPGTLVVVLKPVGEAPMRTLTDEEVEGPIRRLLRNHRNVTFGGSSVGMVNIQEVAIGRKLERRPEYADWVLIVFRVAGTTTDDLGSERENVVHVSFGPRG